MKRTFAMLGTLMAVGAASADDVNWQASVPLWKSLSKSGQVIAAGPAPDWFGETRDPSAKLGAPSRPAPRSSSIASSIFVWTMRWIRSRSCAGC